MSSRHQAPSAEPRLDRFRLSLLLSIRRVSPLALEIVAAEGVALHRIVRWIRPNSSARRNRHAASAHRLRYGFARIVFRQYLGRYNLEDECFRRLSDQRGVVVRKPSHPGGRYGVWVGNGALNVVVGVGRATLEVTGSRGVLKLEESVPHTACAAMLGRPIEQIAGHPLFVGRNYPVVSACETGGTTMITFETGLETIWLPLPRPSSGLVSRTLRRRIANLPRHGDYR